MKTHYYIDSRTHTLKTTVSPESVTDAYKGIFIDNFKLAKEYLEYGYQSKYDLEWGLYEPCIFGLKLAKETKDALCELDQEFQKFVDEYKQYGYSLEDLEKSSEWNARVEINNTYLYYLGFYKFLELDYKDRMKKNIYNKNHYNFVKIRTKYNRSREEMIEEQAEDVFRQVDQELKDMLEQVEANQSAVGLQITNQKVAYSELHKKHKIEPKRANDIKNIMIVYLSERENLLRKLRACELAISHHCTSPQVKGKLVKTKDLSVNDLMWSARQGYNVYHIEKGEVYPALFVWESYNRLAIITTNMKLARNEEYVIVDTQHQGEFLDLQGSFFDYDEYEITDNEMALEAAVNPILTLFYKDKFTDKDDD